MNLKDKLQNIIEHETLTDIYKEKNRIKITYTDGYIMIGKIFKQLAAADKEVIVLVKRANAKAGYDINSRSYSIAAIDYI